MISKNRIPCLCGLLILLLLLSGVQASDIGGVQVFPADHIWNVPVDQLPVDSRSADYISMIGSTKYLHPDFGSGLYDGGPIGIPYNIVNKSVIKQSVTFDYGDESDPGPYPLPASPLIEGGGGSVGDRHLLMVHQDERKVYELYAAEKQPDGSWHAGSGAIFNLSGYELRPVGWTSTDAAGLAVLPGLVRYDEVAAGKITHAIRFTVPQTQKAFIWPARHYASSITDPRYPPMGQRFRLKASFDISGYPSQARVVLEALKKYGMILSDNGGAWYISGAPDDHWDNDALHTLQQVKGSDFEAVDETSLMIDPDSGRAKITLPAPLALPGQTMPPTDSDKDGNYEDLNGNGRKDFSDVVLFFKQLDWITANEPVAAFDYNNNRRVEFSDIVLLFREM
jgi:PKD repeat protein